jgi:hypothetical protein
MSSTVTPSCPAVACHCDDDPRRRRHLGHQDTQRVAHVAPARDAAVDRDEGTEMCRR